MHIPIILPSVRPLLQGAYAQLPAVQGFDASAGAILGGGAGVAYHALQKDKKKSLLGHVTTGAAVGAVVADVAGDRTRRYISNLPAVGSYSVDAITDLMKHHGWNGVWRGAVLDKPLVHDVSVDKDSAPWQLPDPGMPNGWSPTAVMRRELMRRSFGVHTEGASDFFRQVGTTVTPDGRNLPRIELKERLIDPKTGNLRPDPVYGNIYPDLFGNLAFTSGDYPGQNMSRVLAHYNLDRPGNDVVRARDYWDYALEPRQYSQLHDLLKDMLLHPKRLKNALPYEENDLRNAATPSTRGDQLKSFLARIFVNSALLKQPALLDQTLQVDPNTGNALRAFSDVARDQGFTKDDATIATELAGLAR